MEPNNKLFWCKWQHIYIVKDPHAGCALEEQLNIKRKFPSQNVENNFQRWLQCPVTCLFETNKIGENLVVRAWLLSVPVLVKQRCLQYTRAENKRTNKMALCILRVSLQIPLIHWGLIYANFAFPSRRNAITLVRKLTCSLQIIEPTQGCQLEDFCDKAYSAAISACS